MAILEIEDVFKIYGFPPRAIAKPLGYNPLSAIKGQRMVKALAGIDLKVEEGEVFGILGPNGSGKTTLVKLILDIIRPNRGTIKVMGKKPGNKKVHSQIGYLPEQPYFYDQMTGVEILRFYGEIFRMHNNDLRQRIPELLEMVGLMGAENRRIRGYSKGMLQRLGLAQALIARPKLVFLDEPSTGLDPVGRKDTKNIIKRLRDEGTTVFFNTHILSDVEDTADRIAILHKGRKVKEGKVSTLTVSANRLEVTLRKVEEKYKRCIDDLVNKIEVVEEKLTVFLSNADHIPEVIRRLANAGADIFEVKHHRESLEDVFVKAINPPKAGEGRRFKSSWR